MFPTETRILIVDDMVGMRKLIKSSLTEMGYRNVTEAENGKQALDLLLTEQAAGRPFQLILSDWNMPVMTGIELLRAVRSAPETADCPFLLITAEGEFSQVMEAMKLKVSEYIVKPFSPATLKQKFETVWKKTQAQAKA